MAQDIISQFERKFAFPIETYRKVASVTDRNNIPSNVRWEGMLVYVNNSHTTFELSDGISDADWKDLKQQVNVIVEDNVTSTSITNTLSANQGRLLQDQITALSTPAWGTISGTLSAQTDLNNALSQRLTDAPADGFPYGRNNNAWVQVTNTYTTATQSGSISAVGTTSGSFSTVATLGNLANDWVLWKQGNTITVQVGISLSNPSTPIGNLRLSLVSLPSQYVPQATQNGAGHYGRMLVNGSGLVTGGELDGSGNVDIILDASTITTADIKLTFTYNIP